MHSGQKKHTFPIWNIWLSPKKKEYRFPESFRTEPKTCVKQYNYSTFRSCSWGKNNLLLLLLLLATLSPIPGASRQFRSKTYTEPRSWMLAASSSPGWHATFSLGDRESQLITKALLEQWKEPSYFPWITSCLIGILIMAYEIIPHNWVGFHPLFTLKNQMPFFHCSRLLHPGWGGKDIQVIYPSLKIGWLTSTNWGVAVERNLTKQVTQMAQHHKK